VRVGVCVVWSDTNKWPAAGTKKKTRKDYNYYSEMLLVLVFLFIFLGYGTASRLFFAFFLVAVVNSNASLQSLLSDIKSFTNPFLAFPLPSVLPSSFQRPLSFPSAFSSLSMASAVSLCWMAEMAK